MCHLLKVTCNVGSKMNVGNIKDVFVEWKQNIGENENTSVKYKYLKVLEYMYIPSVNHHQPQPTGCLT